MIWSTKLLRIAICWFVMCSGTSAEIPWLRQFISGVFVDKYQNDYSVKTDLTPVYVDELTKFCSSPAPHNKLFHIMLRFHFAPKKSIIKMRLTKGLFPDEHAKDIHFPVHGSPVCIRARW